MLRLLRNPLFIYVLGFAFAFLVYALDWSAIYPKLSRETKWFFATAFVLYILWGVLIAFLKLIRDTPSRTSSRLITNCVLVLFALYAVEFVYARDIPLLAVLLGRPGVGYREFGIPLMHGVIISFNSFLIAHSFATYLSTRNKKILFYNFLLYLPALLIINRSIIVFGLLTALFIYIHYVRRIKLSAKVGLVIVSLVCLYLFGVLGNLRSGGEYIYKESKATEDFMESNIPKEFYWTYLYVGSPLANFQHTVNRRHVEEYDFIGFVFYENLPQIISKKFGESLNIEQRDLVRIVPWLTVGTTYAKSYSYLGWWGPYLLLFGNLFIYLMVLLLVPRRSSYHVTAIAILSVIVLLSTFTNMLVVTGISFQLVYCIIFSFFDRKKIVLRI